MHLPERTIPLPERSRREWPTLTVGRFGSARRPPRALSGSSRGPERGPSPGPERSRRAAAEGPELKMRTSSRPAYFCALSHMATYSNLRAGRALVRASLQAILRSPSAVIFGLAFPLIFILVFGMLGSGSSGFSARLSLAPGSDTANPIYAALRATEGIKWKTYPDTVAQAADLNKGNIAAMVSIQKLPPGNTPQYRIHLRAASSKMG